MSGENKMLVRRWFEEFFNEEKLEFSFSPGFPEPPPRRA